LADFAADGRKAFQESRQSPLFSAAAVEKRTEGAEAALDLDQEKAREGKEGRM